MLALTDLPEGCRIDKKRSAQERYLVRYRNDWAILVSLEDPLDGFLLNLDEFGLPQPPKRSWIAYPQYRGKSERIEQIVYDADLDDVYFDHPLPALKDAVRIIDEWVR